MKVHYSPPGNTLVQVCRNANPRRASITTDVSRVTCVKCLHFLGAERERRAALDDLCNRHSGVSAKDATTRLLAAERVQLDAQTPDAPNVHLMGYSQKTDEQLDEIARDPNAAVDQVDAAKIALRARARRTSKVTRALLAPVVALLLVTSACTSTTAPTSTSINGQWIASAAPFSTLRAVLGTSDAGIPYGTLYADVANCVSANPLDCHLQGTVTGSQTASDVVLVATFSAVHAVVTFTGHTTRDETLVGSISFHLDLAEQHESTPVDVTFRR
jgi:hypothetical protein